MNTFLLFLVVLVLGLGFYLQARYVSKAKRRDPSWGRRVETSPEFIVNRALMLRLAIVFLAFLFLLFRLLGNF